MAGTSSSFNLTKRIYLCFKKDKEVPDNISYCFLVFFNSFSGFEVFSFEDEEAKLLCSAIKLIPLDKKIFYDNYILLPVSFSDKIYDTMYEIHVELQTSNELNTLEKNTSVYIKIIINVVKNIYKEPEIEILECTPKKLYETFNNLLQHKRVSTATQKKSNLVLAYEWISSYFTRTRKDTVHHLEEV
jgi:hypothetical protein